MELPCYFICWITKRDDPKPIPDLLSEAAITEPVIAELLHMLYKGPTRWYVGGGYEFSLPGKLFFSRRTENLFFLFSHIRTIFFFYLLTWYQIDKLFFILGVIWWSNYFFLAKSTDKLFSQKKLIAPPHETSGPPLRIFLEIISRNPFRVV